MNIQSSNRKCHCICFVGGLFVFWYIFRQQWTNFLFKPSLRVWHSNEQRISRPNYINRDHGFCGPCPQDQQISNAWRLIDLIHEIPSTHPFLVNIGAASANGGQYDPTFTLLNETESFSALLVDPNTNPALFNAYPHRSNIQIIHDFIWSETIIETIFKRYRIPQNLTILKVDIDSYECTLLQTILQANYRPQFIHTEFNPIFRPPIIFKPIYNSTTKYDWQPALWATSGPFYGCSLSALSRIVSSFDYVLLDVDFWDVIYIQRQLAVSYHIQVPANDETAYRNGFLNHSCFPYCKQNVKLHNNQIADAIEIALQKSNFNETMKQILDIYAPISTKTNVKHPYIIST